MAVKIEVNGGARCRVRAESKRVGQSQQRRPGTHANASGNRTLRFQEVSLWSQLRTELLWMGVLMLQLLVQGPLQPITLVIETRATRRIWDSPGLACCTSADARSSCRWSETVSGSAASEG